MDPHTRRVFVNDRANNRAQVFDENGKFLDQWSFGGPPSDIHLFLIDGAGFLWAADRGTNKILKYSLDGTLLWRIDLGRNIREGAHYTPFIVYDLDGDGRAEVACRTADGTLDGRGMPIGDAQADHRNQRGYVLSGPEFLTVFDGLTGAALATVDYVPPRGDVRSWGDDYGNRVDRFLACVAYLDGRRPSLVMCRGYYTRAVLAAWNWRGSGSMRNRNASRSACRPAFS